MMMDFRNFDVRWFFRKKRFDPTNIDSTKLARCLGLLELTALGIGATLGAGIYVVTPDSTRHYAGPAICVSFLIAALASILSGLCYAELGARVPRAGSAYVYSYVAVGEFWAFIVGWNMILEYVIGTASVARAAVIYIDVLANGTLANAFRTAMPMNVSFLGEYVDPFAFGITLILTILLSVGVNESTFVNNILVMVNCGILVYIVAVGFVYANPNNWHLTLEQVQNATKTNGTEFGTGGFMPYGFGGVMTAASAAFYSFVGFDCIATTGEEVKNPRRNIPLSIVLSLAVCATAYFCVSTVFTLDTPYYDLSSKTLLPNAPGGYIVVSVGAILCSTTSLLGGMFPLPRVIYAMAEDGLLFSFLAYISPRFKTPLIATLASGFLTACFASIFDVDQLVGMLSIGTLMAYSMVAASVLVLRYRESFVDTAPEKEESTEDETLILSNTDDQETLSYGTVEPTKLPENEEETRLISTYLLGLVDFSGPKRPSPFTSMLAVILTCLICAALIVTAIFARIFVTFAKGAWWPGVVIGISGTVCVLLTSRLWRLPQNTSFETFQIPVVPLLPILALAVNFYLLVSLNYDTWIRFAVWMTIGFVIFFFYGIWQSKARAAVVVEETSLTPSSSGIETSSPLDISSNNEELPKGEENTAFSLEEKIVDKE